ncbi:MAG: hypothetical protein BWZ02_03349 [Lentisphaerae bacterium ADurb.BinA184]|nr:MAG: hypothetical protein BWZ02_03349 [Lentisphaerae bacterium ADurb.BinA184]
MRAARSWAASGRAGCTLATRLSASSAALDGSGVRYFSPTLATSGTLSDAAGRTTGVSGSGLIRGNSTGASSVGFSIGNVSGGAAWGAGAGAGSTGGVTSVAGSGLGSGRAGGWGCGSGSTGGVGVGLTSDGAGLGVGAGSAGFSTSAGGLGAGSSASSGTKIHLPSRKTNRASADAVQATVRNRASRMTSHRMRESSSNPLERSRRPAEHVRPVGTEHLAHIDGGFLR